MLKEIRLIIVIPLLSFRSARAWHSLLAERHTGKKGFSFYSILYGPVTGLRKRSRSLSLSSVLLT